MPTKFLLGRFEIFKTILEQRMLGIAGEASRGHTLKTTPPDPKEPVRMVCDVFPHGNFYTKESEPYPEVREGIRTVCQELKTDGM